jgi:hypothetical protein
MPDMRRVFSSHIDAVGYDPNSQELHVTFQGKKGQPGKTAIYFGVPADVARMVTEAPSIGTALHQFVKDKFAHGYKP